MYHIKYTAKDAKKEADNYNCSLDKDLKLAEKLIQEAAQKGYSGCSLSDVRVEHWDDIKKALEKLGYKVDIKKHLLNFNVYWDESIYYQFI